MFCNNHHHTTSVSASSVLRSFRSHRNLKHQIRHLQDGEAYQPCITNAPAPPVHHQRPVPNHPMGHHPRRPSEASSIETLNSDTSFPDHHSNHGRPSTSSRREGSIDINPLRLHPPTEDDLFMSSPTTSLRSPPRHHYTRNHLGSSDSTSSTESNVDMGRPPTLSFRDRFQEHHGHQRMGGGFFPAARRSTHHACPEPKSRCLRRRGR